MTNSFTQPPRRVTLGSRATKILCAAATCVAPSPGFATGNASKIEAARPFESHLRRSIVIEGEGFTVSRKLDRRLYWARIGHVGRELLPESETRLFSPDSRMSRSGSSNSQPQKERCSLASSLPPSLLFGGERTEPKTS